MQACEHVSARRPGTICCGMRPLAGMLVDVQSARGGDRRRAAGQSASSVPPGLVSPVCGGAFYGRCKNDLRVGPPSPSNQSPASHACKSHSDGNAVGSCVQPTWLLLQGEVAAEPVQNPCR